MLHICQRCKESWSGRYIAAHRDRFDVDPLALTVDGCPNCPDSGADQDDKRTTSDVPRRDFYVCRRCSEMCTLSMVYPSVWPSACPIRHDAMWDNLDHSENDRRA